VADRAPRGIRPAAVSKLKVLRFDGPAGALEGLLQEHQAREPTLTAVICHPHPLHGGTLHNKVVHRLASVLHELGAAVLRFNFRGVGESEGRFDHGRGELEDARAALAWMRARHPGSRRWAAGFSFGAWVAARLAASDHDVERVVLVAPPVTTADFSILRGSRVPKVVIQGTRDDVCPPERLAREYPLWSEPKSLHWVEGASHFFDRKLGALAEALHRALEPAARAAPTPRP
jgi:hypothetical protein